ncbi:MAG: hypothetical protein ACLUCI_11925 [Blautia hansenii]
MKVFYYNGKSKCEKAVNNLYHDVAVLLAEESVTQPVTVEITDCTNPNQFLKYRISLRSGTRFIVELDNTMPDCYLPTHIKPVFLTCVKPENNAYKFYKLEQLGHQVRATYGRMGVRKGELFGERNFDYPLSMFWIKYFEKLSKGYVDRTDLYLSDEKDIATEQNDRTIVMETDSNRELFCKLKQFAISAVKQAEVQVPITAAILKHSEGILDKMRKEQEVTLFNNYLLELLSILQRPVKTGDGSGVRNLMAKDKTDFLSIIEREDDLIQAMKGSYYGNKSSNSTTTRSFSDYGIEVYEANEEQKKEVMRKLNDTLKGKVSKIYRVIPVEQKKRFDAYLKQNNIRKVKQFWHGSRNQNWTSIIINSLKLNPDAIITGKMFGNGVYFAPSSMKSWNYTSYRGTSWANGDADVAFMGLYATAYGTPKDVDIWDATTDYKKMVQAAKANCLHAHKGISLQNDEIIFYHEDAMLLNYIVEFK